MAFKKEIKYLDKSNINLIITVPKDDVHKQYQDMLSDYIKDIQLPGFRKGKVPKEVFERKYADALKQDALSRIIESTLQEVLQDENLPRNEKPLPYATPELQGEPKFEFEQDLQFSVVYDVLPEVKIGSWKGIKAEYSYAEVEETDIERELEAIRERNAIVMDKDDSAQAAKNDVVTINYLVMEEDGVTESKIKRDDFVFTLGSNTNLYQFDDEITGMKKSETKEFEKKFEEGFFEPSLCGKSRKVRITLTSLKEKKLPDLDDDLAQDVDEKYKTLEDLKNNIKDRLIKNLEKNLRDVKTGELLKIIMENTPVVIPESMIKAEVDGRIRRMAQYYNVDADSMMQIMSLDDKRQNEWRETAVKALHSRLIIETLMEEQKIEATSEDIEKEFESIASANNAEVEEIRKHYNEQALLYLKEDIKEKKITDILLAENTLIPGKKENYLDFMPDNG
ncbi:MAG: trigger factor [Treponema sp.]|nr:trigger factor [Treponema sp.]